MWKRHQTQRVGTTLIGKTKISMRSRKLLLDGLARRYEHAAAVGADAGATAAAVAMPLSRADFMIEVAEGLIAHEKVFRREQEVASEAGSARRSPRKSTAQATKRARQNEHEREKEKAKRQRQKIEKEKVEKQIPKKKKEARWSQRLQRK
eukprot:SAG11_NODE_18845_length_480_cov_0.692913_1_plen_149_part_01